MVRITILGTNHISPKSIAQVEKYGEEKDILAIELDKHRLQTLFSEQKPSYTHLIRTIGIKGTLFALLASYAEKKLGGTIGTKPGGEMRKAAQMAAEQKKMLALIDQPIHTTLKKMNAVLRFSLVPALFRFAKNAKHLRFNPAEIPSQEQLENILFLVQQHLPKLYSVLIHERNIYMVKQIVQLYNHFPDKSIFVIVGAGHVPGMTEELKKKDIEIKVI